MAYESFTDGVTASLTPWSDDGGPFDTLVAALASMFETVWAIVSDQGSPDDPDTYRAGWSILLDPERCSTWLPALVPWMGLFVGAGLPSVTPVSVSLPAVLALRTLARGQGFAGTYNSQTGAQGGVIVTTAQTQLSGNQTVTLLERQSSSGSDAYHFILVVDTSELLDATALTDAVNSVKPAGVMWTLIQTTSWIIAQLEADYSTIGDVETAFTTIGNLEGDVTS